MTAEQTLPSIPHAKHDAERRATIRNKSNWLPLLLLLVLVVPLRGWLMYNTEVLARDSVVYINYAMQLEKGSWSDALNGNHQHPGYPLSILAVSVPVRQLLGPADSRTMQISAQLASNLAALLLIFPMYALSRFFFERRVAFWSTLLFQFLPVSGQHLSDGVSEALFLLLTSTAFLCSVWAVRQRSTLLFVGCGVFCGLAYLTRPEGALVVVSTILVLCVGPLIRGWHQSWMLNLRQGLIMLLASLAVGSLYFGVTGKFTNKPSLRLITTAEEFSEAPDEDTGGQPLFASIFANAVDKNVPLSARLGKGMFIFGAEYIQIFHYAGFLALAFGTVRRLPRLFTVPEFLVPSVFVFIHCMLILALACKAGYLSNRHLLVVAIWGVQFTAAGFCDFPGWVGRWLAHWQLGKAAFLLSGRFVRRATLLLLLAFVALCLPRTMAKLHANQAGNHQAGLWLAKQFRKGDFIRDDHSWTLYYAEGIFHEAPEPEPGREAKSFVIVTRSRDPKVAKIQMQQEKDMRAAKGEIVYRWPEQASVDEARVLIFAVNRKPGGWWNNPP